MALLAALLAALTVAYTIYQLIPIPASYWADRLSETFDETAEEPLPELTSVFPEGPANTQDELVAAAITESPQPLSAPAGKPAIEKSEPKVRGFGVVGMAAVSLAAILLAVGLGTLAVTRTKKRD